MTGFKAVAVIGLGLLASGMASADAKEWKTIKIATEGAFRPWNFVEGGKLDGFDVELANELCKRMQVTCELMAQDWDGIIPALQAGKYDAIMAAMTITPKRREVIEFSRTYAVGPHGFAVQKGGPLAKLPGAGKSLSLTRDAEESKKVLDGMREMLKGKVVAAQVSTTDLAFLEKYFGDVATVRSYKTTEQHDLDLIAGRVDLIMTGVTALNATIEKPGYEGLTLAGPTFTNDVFGEGTGVGLRKSDPELKAMFDTAINSTIADGTLKALQLKWFKMDNSPHE
jgi:octopine/nopaline transport system substrate-binding protein